MGNDCGVGVFGEIEQFALLIDDHDVAIANVDDLDVAPDNALHLFEGEIGAVGRSDFTGSIGRMVDCCHIVVDWMG